MVDWMDDERTAEGMCIWMDGQKGGWFYRWTDG